MLQENNYYSENGSDIVNIEPLLISLKTVISPPCAFATARAKLNPSPQPSLERL